MLALGRAAGVTRVAICERISGGIVLLVFLFLAAAAVPTNALRDKAGMAAFACSFIASPFSLLSYRKIQEGEDENP